MNRYQAMMGELPIPEGQAERLKAAVLAGKQRRSLRPRRVGRRTLLAALVTAGLLASAGAALEAANWSPAFLERFGSESRDTPGAEGVFREVNAANTCGGVTLTVRQAIGDEKNLYILLDYQLPEDADLEAARGGAALPVSLGRKNLTWEEIRDRDPEELRSAFLFDDGGYSLHTQYLDFDPESRTLRYLIGADLSDLPPLKRLLNPPVTLLAFPPEAQAGEGTVPLTDRAAVVTFRPTFDAATVSGTAETDSNTYRAEVSPLSFQVHIEGADIPVADFHASFEGALALRFRDGTVTPAAELEPPGGDSGGNMGSSRSGDGRYSGHILWNTVFGRLIDPAEVEAVLVGDVEILVD